MGKIILTPEADTFYEVIIYQEGSKRSQISGRVYRVEIITKEKEKIDIEKGIRL